MEHDPDTFVEVTHESWGDRIFASLKGIIVGLILIPISIGILTWNEEQAVDRTKALQAAAQAVVAIEADRIDPANEGKLVHISGKVRANAILSDSEFGLQVPAIRLVRNVETYQWLESSKSETKEKIGGGSETTTTYSYRKDWALGLVDSASFKAPEGHTNPPYALLHGTSQQAEPVWLDAFTLNEAMVSALDDLKDVDLRQSVSKAPTELRGRPVTLTGNAFYIGDSPNTPRIGDTRVTFQMAAPAEISIISQQRGSSFKPYATPSGDVELIEYGLKSPEAMFRTAEHENTLFTWSLRFAGFLLMFIGFKLVFAIFETIAAVIPPLGWLTGSLLSVVAGGLAFILSTVVIGTAWMAQRPLVAMGFIVVLLGATVAIWYHRRQKRQQSPTM